MAALQEHTDITWRIQIRGPRPDMVMIRLSSATVPGALTHTLCFWLGGPSDVAAEVDREVAEYRAYLRSKA